jgi:hypothetical protein
MPLLCDRVANDCARERGRTCFAALERPLCATQSRGPRHAPFFYPRQYQSLATAHRHCIGRRGIWSTRARIRAQHRAVRAGNSGSQRTKAIHRSAFRSGDCPRVGPITSGAFWCRDAQTFQSLLVQAGAGSRRPIHVLHGGSHLPIGSCAGRARADRLGENSSR